MEDDFTAHAQRFVRSAGSAQSHWDWRLKFGEWCFWGVGCGCDIGICVSGLHRSCVFVTRLSSIGDFGGWECAQKVPKSFQTCGYMILSLFVAGAVLCAGFEVWKWDFRGRRRGA